MIVKILDIKNVTHDVKSFKVEKPEGFKFVPGQATDVAINKPGWEGKARPLTFTSLNEDPYLEFIVKSYPLALYPNHTGVTEEMHKLVKGDELIIDDPWGAISYHGGGVFIAGGAGITPFIAIIRQLRKNGKIFGNKMIFSNKTGKDVILEDELKASFPPRDLILTLTRERKKGYKFGRIDAEFLKKHIKDFQNHFYICGPRQMVFELKNTLSLLGASTDLLVFEK